MKKRAEARRPQPAVVAPQGRGFAPVQLYWIAPFFLFLVLRFFSGDPFYLLGGDQCTFLELGRTFPKHELFNHELYLIHTPLYGYAIGVLQLVLPLLTAGLLATLLFACVYFFAVRELGRFEGCRRPRSAWG